MSNENQNGSFAKNFIKALVDVGGIESGAFPEMETDTLEKLETVVESKQTETRNFKADYMKFALPEIETKSEVKEKSETISTEQLVEKVVSAPVPVVVASSGVKPPLIIPSPEGMDRGVNFETAAQTVFTSEMGKNLYWRSGQITALTNGKLKQVKEAKLSCDILSNFRTQSWKRNPKTKAVELVNINVSAWQLSQLLEASCIGRILPNVEIISNIPIILPSGEIVSNGCHEGTLIDTRMEIKRMEIAKAVVIINNLISDFKCTTLADKSRMISLFLTPALKFGGVLKDIKTPMFQIFADKSQAGKGLCCGMVQSVYNAQISPVTQHSGKGTGSFTESLDTALVSGAPFVLLDNVRENFDSVRLEMMLTFNGLVSCRPSYSPGVEINPFRRIFLLTANKGANTSEDLMNRSSVINILKREEGYKYQVFDGKYTVVQYIEHHRAEILSAIYTILQDWIQTGMQKKECPFHDFCEWAEMLTFITDKYFGLPSPTEGHAVSKAIRSNETFVWWSELGHKMIEKKLDGHYTATELKDFAKEFGLKVPKDSFVIGSYARILFGQEAEAKTLEDIIWEKTETTGYKQGTNQEYDKKTYHVSSINEVNQVPF